MPEVLGSAVLELKTDSTGLVRGLREGKRSAEDLQRTFRKVGEAATRLGRTLSLSITVPLTAAATAFIVLADKQIQAEAALTNAIRATGREAEISVDALKDFTSELQDVTTFGDEAQLSALALTQQLANLDQAGLQAVLPGMLDFASAMGVDLQTAASLFGKTLGSSTNALTRYGIELDTAASPTEKLAQLTLALEERFGGAAAAAAAAGLGPFRQMKNAAGDLAEEFGTLLLPAVNAVVDVFQTVIDWLSSLDDSTKRIILTMGGLAAALGPVALGIGLVSKAMAAMALPPAGTVLLVITAIALLVLGLVTLAERLKGARRGTDELKEALRELSLTEQASFNVTFLEGQIALAEARVEASEAALEAMRAQREELQKQAEGARILDPVVIQLRRANEEFDRQSGLVDIARASLDGLNEKLAESQAVLEGTIPPVGDLGDEIREASEKWQRWQELMKAGGSDDPFKFIVEGSADAESGLTTLDLQFGNVFIASNLLFASIVLNGEALGKLGMAITTFSDDQAPGLTTALTTLELQFGNVFIASNLLFQSLIDNGEALKSLGEEITDFGDVVDRVTRALPGQVTGGPPGPIAGPFQPTPNAGGIDPGVAIAFTDALMSAIPELATLASVAGVLGLLFEGFTNVVGDLIAGPLATLIGAVVMVGEIFGTLLAPVIQLVTDVMMFLAAGFVWFYNNVLLKIGNVIIGIFKLVITVAFVFAQAIVDITNVIIGLLNRIPGVDIDLRTNPITQPNFTTGWLKPIKIDDLTDLGGGDDDDDTGGAGATFRQQRPIDITINVFDNQVFGGNLQDFAIMLRNEILDITELGL